METLKFVLVCAAVFAGIILVAWLCEKRLTHDRKLFSSTHYISYTAVFASMAGVLMLVELPLFFAPSFYKLDISELPILICTFYLGPVAGVVAELVKVLVKLIIKGTTTAYVGDFAKLRRRLLFCASGQHRLPREARQEVRARRHGRRHSDHDRVRQRFQRDISSAEVCRDVRHAARRPSSAWARRSTPR